MHEHLIEENLCGLLFIFLLCMMTSCGQQKKNEFSQESSPFIVNVISQQQESFPPPQVVQLANRPKPLTVEVPKKPGGSYVTLVNKKR